MVGTSPDEAGYQSKESTKVNNENEYFPRHPLGKIIDMKNHGGIGLGKHVSEIQARKQSKASDNDVSN